MEKDQPLTCPECGEEIEFHNYDPTAAFPETYIPYCESCEWEGDPE